MPSYLLRFNPGARRLRISVSARRGVVVTVPRGVSQHAALEFLRSKRAWVIRTCNRIGEREARRRAQGHVVPHNVAFPAIGEQWRIRLRATSARGVRVLRPSQGQAPRSDCGRPVEVVLSGNVSDVSACLGALNRFVGARAREMLPAEIQTLASMAGVRPAAVSIRHQRARWGSCSTTGAISLNRTLLFLPRELAHAVMLHELAHLIRHDHSRQFWEALERLDPLARSHRKALRDAWRFVPGWAEAPHPESSGDI